MRRVCWPASRREGCRCLSRGHGLAGGVSLYWWGLPLLSSYRVDQTTGYYSYFLPTDGTLCAGKALHHPPRHQLMPRGSKLSFEAHHILNQPWHLVYWLGGKGHTRGTPTKIADLTAASRMRAACADLTSVESRVASEEGIRRETKRYK